MPAFLPTTLRFADLSATPACDAKSASMATARKPASIRPAQRIVSGRSYQNALAALLGGSLTRMDSGT